MLHQPPFLSVAVYVVRKVVTTKEALKAEITASNSAGECET